MDAIDNYLSGLSNSLLHIDKKEVRGIVDSIRLCSKLNGIVYVMGNGGSATTASHFAGDLFKTCGIKTVSLVDSNYLITAFANDFNYESVFGMQLGRHKPADDNILYAISGSGNSENIIRALIAFRDRCLTIGLTGMGGGKLKDLCDICLVVDNDCMEQIEDIHLAICHMIVTILKGE